MTKPTQQTKTVDELHQKPLITYGVLGQAYMVGPARIKGLAQKLGIKPQRMMNARELLTFEQSKEIVRAMTQ